jgi:hypothetical protein
MYKVCSHCGIEKNISEFVRRSILKTGFTAHCRACQVKLTTKWNKANPEKRRIAYRKWWETHKEYVKEAHRQWNLSNAEKKKEAWKRWRAENPEKNLASINRAAKVRLSTLKGRLNLRIASAIRSTLKQGTKKNRHWESLVNFTIDQLKAHLEKLFTPEMSWENYGTYWSIDHKIPVAVFNFERPGDIDFRLCWSIKNLQPMEKLTNISKGAKIDEPFQPSLAIGGN